MCILHFFKILLVPLTILFNEPFKAEVCWDSIGARNSVRSTFTMLPHQDVDSNRGFHGCKPSAFPTELSRYPLSIIYIWLLALAPLE